MSPQIPPHTVVFMPLGNPCPWRPKIVLCYQLHTAEVMASPSWDQFIKKKGRAPTRFLPPFLHSPSCTHTPGKPAAKPWRHWEPWGQGHFTACEEVRPQHPLNRAWKQALQAELRRLQPCPTFSCGLIGLKARTPSSATPGSWPLATMSLQIFVVLSC